MRHSYLLLFVLVVYVSSCFKKGEDDPSISLRTRKDRVAGEWKVTSIQKIDSITGTLNKWYYSFNGSEFIDSHVVIVNNRIVEKRIKKGKRQVTYVFRKNGNYSLHDYIDDDTTIVNGKWAFNDKTDYTKKKISIYIHPSEIYSTSFYQNTGSPSYGIRQSGGEYLCAIRELRHDKMVWEDLFQDWVEVNGTPWVRYNTHTIITLEPK